ncbi:MAG: YdcF family protein [Myxococcota bacterium]|nr:YdcF family protein [Myxococcota bacterium]
MLDFVKSFLVSPFGIAFLLLLGSVVLGGRMPARSRQLAAVSLAIFWIAAAPYPSNLLHRLVEGPHKPLPRDEAVDAIMVLGGGLQSTGKDSQGVDLGSAGDRVIAASRLYREGVAERVISTGGRKRDERSEAEGMASLLEEWGVPPESILIEDASHNTRENCVFSLEIAKPLGIERVALVTSALHMRRASAACRKAGFDVVPAPTDWEFQSPEALDWESWIPTPVMLERTHRAVHEVVGSLYYALRSWI